MSYRVYVFENTAESCSEGVDVTGDIHSPIFDEPLASEAELSQFWTIPATALGQVTIQQLNCEGFESSRKDLLLKLAAETRKIKNFWIDIGVKDEKLRHLEERAGYLLAAIDIALEKNATLSIF